MGFFGFINVTAETSELHSDGLLRSRYYKANYEKVKEAIIAYAKTIKTTVKSVDDTHREIFLQADRFHMIVSCVQVNPIETSVDFKVQFYGVIGLYRPKKKITDAYKHLDQQLTLKGVSLHP